MTSSLALWLQILLATTSTDGKCRVFSTFIKGVDSRLVWILSDSLNDALKKIQIAYFCLTCDRESGASSSSNLKFGEVCILQFILFSWTNLVNVLLYCLFDYAFLMDVCADLVKKTWAARMCVHAPLQLRCARSCLFVLLHADIITKDYKGLAWIILFSWHEARLLTSMEWCIAIQCQTISACLTCLTFTCHMACPEIKCMP